MHKVGTGFALGYGKTVYKGDMVHINVKHYGWIECKIVKVYSSRKVIRVQEIGHAYTTDICMFDVLNIEELQQ